MPQSHQGGPPRTRHRWSATRRRLRASITAVVLSTCTPISCGRRGAHVPAPRPAPAVASRIASAMEIHNRLLEADPRHPRNFSTRASPIASWKPTLTPVGRSPLIGPSRAGLSANRWLAQLLLHPTLYRGRAVAAGDATAGIRAEAPPRSTQFDAIVTDPDLYLDMMFEPGDLQFLNNRTILHSRTDYEDHPVKAQRRPPACGCGSPCRNWPRIAGPVQSVPFRARQANLGEGHADSFDSRAPDSRGKCPTSELRAPRRWTRSLSEVSRAQGPGMGTPVFDTPETVQAQL